tara:strand:+ start:460 stop:597 length:138 start_codon:yes stop_codon:yes gene_type:complete
MAQWVRETANNEGITEDVFTDSAVRVEAKELIDELVEGLTTGPFV